MTNQILSFNTIVDRLCEKFSLERKLFENFEQKIASNPEYETDDKKFFPFIELQKTDSRSIQYVYFKKTGKIEIFLIFEYKHLEKVLQIVSELKEFEYLKSTDGDSVASYNYPFDNHYVTISVYYEDRVVLIIGKNLIEC